MGKGRGNEPPQNAFTRMNFLYQAAQLMSDSSLDNSLPSYYGKVMRDISKKIVEKIHPDVKGTLCKACSFPFLKKCDVLDVKLKAAKNKSKKRKTKKKAPDKSKCEDSVTENATISRAKAGCYKKFQKSRIDARNKRPNKVCYTCNHCGFSKQTLQRPSYQIWINKKEAYS